MKNPLIPMAAITGKPTKEEIDKIMRLYSQAGIQQFLIYPRSGCEVEYMSEQWLEVCRYIIEAAEREKMDIWLYDEYNWPSGTCNGKVMQENKEFYAKSVFIEDGKCIIKKYDKYFDILNSDAVECFIKNTHEVYYKHFGRYFGSVIKGIFTDEPDLYACTWNGGKYPYTKNLDIIYKEKCGRDLFDDMVQATPSEEFNCAYWSLLGELFRTNFLKRINDWCVSHNIVLTGHTMEENNINNAVKTCGNTISALRCFSLPGMDEIFTKTSIDTAEWLTMGCAEAAIRVAGNGGLAELFALGPTDIVPARIEQMIWLSAMFKVNHYLLAVSALDARGNLEKFEYYNPMCYTNPWFEGYKDFSVSALNAAKYAEKTFTPQVVVRYPARLASKYIFTEKQNLVNERLYDVLKLLVRNQYQWQLIDEDEPACDGAYLVEIDDPDVYSADKIIADIDKVIVRNLCVLENDELADDIMIRQYDDGSFAILDLKDSRQSRNLTIVYNDKKYEISLCGRGHFTSDEKVIQEAEIHNIENVVFDIKLNSKNTLRCAFNENNMEFIFDAEDNFSAITLAIRNYHFDGEITLDGIKVEPKNQCKTLKKGLNELYLSTDEFELKKGRHIITLNKPSVSEFYLPSCFICGDFAADKNNNLRRLPETVLAEQLDENVFPQYSGSISYETHIKVPDKNCSIRFESSELYTKLYINDCYLGGQWSDYCWNIPSKYLGTNAKIKIIQYTSIGPIFGSAENCVKLEDYGEKYTELFPGRYQKTGITDLRFVERNEC